MFNFEILHTPGTLNPADPASRRPNYVADKHTDDKDVLLGFRSSESDAADICALTLTGNQDTTYDPSFMPVNDFTLQCIREL